MVGVETWTAEEIAKLHALRTEGLGPCEIARRMGLTKGKVIGRLYRHAMKEPKSTTAERLDALHSKMDEILRKTEPVIARSRELSALARSDAHPRDGYPAPHNAHVALWVGRQ